MKLPSYLVRTAHGYAFRLRVPRDLAPVLPQASVKHSLRGYDTRQAHLAALLLAERYARFFDSVRGQLMAGKFDKWQIGQKHTGLDISEFIIDQDEAKGLRFRSEPHDTPETLAAGVEAFKALLAAAKPPAPVNTPPANLRAITAKEAQTSYLAAIKADTLPKTFTIKEAAIAGFVEHFTRNEPRRKIAEASRPEIADWVQSLRNGGLASSTITNKISYLTGFFAWLMEGGFYPKGDNPAKGQAKFGSREKRLRRRYGFRAFTIEEIRKIYAPEALAHLNPEARWGALFGLYTGARVSEVGQLERDNIMLGTGACFRFTDEGTGQSLKTDVSRRLTPIHPDLMALGLADRLQALRAAGDKRFFPGVSLEGVNGAGNWLSKAFSRHLKGLGILSQDDGPKVGFHSLRKTVVQAMQSHGVSAEMRAQFVGHELEDEHRTVYSRQYTIPELAEAINPALSYGLDLEAIKPILGEPKRRRRR